MKIDRINEYVLATTIVAIGTVLAIAFGRFAGTGDNFWLVAFAAAVVYITTCLTLRIYIWVLIPMFWACSGQLNSAPGHLPLRDLIVGGVVVYFFTLKAFKIIRSSPTYGWLDAILAINLLYIVSLYLRNPVGVNAFGSEMVGGRAYLEVIFAVAGYWVLNQIILPARLAKVLPLLLCAVKAVLAVISTITFIFPATAPILGKLYGGVEAGSYVQQQQNGGSGTDDPDAGDLRAGYLADVGTTIFNLACSYLSPLTLINPLYFWRCVMACIAFFFCLKSGFRTTIPAIAITMILATYFRKGIAATIILLLIGLPPVLLLIVGQGNLYELPETAQRTLCIFPGKWDPAVVQEAQNSVDWRVQMWDQMMHEDKYIQNKMFGDGFGFTREQLESMAINGTQEDFMIVNDPHSGPISTIKVAGYFGFGLFVLLLLGCSIRAWHLIRAARDTPFYPLALFLGIGTIAGSFGYVFIFGDFKSALPNMVLGVAELNLISNGLAVYRKSTDAPIPVPPPKKIVQPLAPIPLPAPALH